MAHLWRSENNFGTQLSPCTVWVVVIELKSSGMTFTHWAISAT